VFIIGPEITLPEGSSDKEKSPKKDKDVQLVWKKTDIEEERKQLKIREAELAAAEYVRYNTL